MRIPNHIKPKIQVKKPKPDNVVVKTHQLRVNKHKTKLQAVKKLRENIERVKVREMVCLVHDQFRIQRFANSIDDKTNLS